MSTPQTKTRTAAHSSRTLLRGGNPNPALSKNQSRFCKPFLPQNRFAKTSPNCICTPPALQVFGQCVGLYPSVQGSFKPPRTRSVRSHRFWK